MATRKIKRFQEGGMSDKDRGLEASKDEKVGFFERLRMGNIDDEGSEAYRRFGAGRGKAERTPVETMTATSVESVKPSQPSVSEDRLAAGRKEGERKDTGDASVAEMYSGPRTKPIEKSPSASIKKAKPSASTATSSGNTSAYPMTKAQPATKTYDRSGGPTAEELANYKPPSKNQSLVSQIPGESNAKPVAGERVENMSDSERNLKNMLAATGVGAGAVGALYKGKKILDARKAAQEGAKKRANLKRDVEEGIERNLADEFQSLSSSAAAKKTAGGKKTSDYRSLAGSAREDAKANQAYDKLKQLSSRGANKTPSKKTKKFDDESNIEFKRGGSVSNASKRADGIATKGKTRCKIY